jgi:phasin
VSDANVNVEANANSSKINGSVNPGFDAPFFTMPDLFRGFAEQGADRAKANCQKLKAASGEVAAVLHEACLANAKGAADYGAKIIEISTENTNSALEFMADLMDTRSLSEALSISAAQSRKNLEMASVRNRALWEFAQKIAIQSAEPIKKSFAKALQGAL